jgi:hypothetical protein
MGFWQGLNEGFTYTMEQKARKKEREEEIALRKQEREEARAEAREMFMLQTTESRRDNLLGLFAKREQEKAAAGALTGQAQSFFSRLEGVDDPRVEALMASPAVAAELEATVREIEVERAKSDLDLPPLRGEVLLDLLTVKAPDGSVRPVSFGLDEILEMDLSDRGSYERTMLELGSPEPRPYATVNPEAYRKVDPKVLEEGRKVFDQEVIRLARGMQAAVGEDATEFAEIEGLLTGYNEEGSAARVALQDMFGMQAFENLAKSDNPYIQNIEQDPQLSRFSAVAKLNMILSDPKATPEEKARAEALLRRLKDK